MDNEEGAGVELWRNFHVIFCKLHPILLYLNN